MIYFTITFHLLFIYFSFTLRLLFYLLQHSFYFFFCWSNC
nr:MAG TPA: hypothetical protein [Caudoviricetes sp.]